MITSAPGITPILSVLSIILDIVCLVTNSSQNRTLHDLIAGTVVIGD